MIACREKQQVTSDTKRKNFTGEFTAKVALEAIRGIKSVNEIGQIFGVHPTLIGPQPLGEGS
jgi:transposase-like protein